MGFIADQLRALFTNSSNNNPAAAAGARIPILNSNNQVVGSDSEENVAAAMAKKGVGGAVRYGNNVFIAVLETDGYYRFYLPEYFPASSVSKAVGVLVRDGDNHIIIAKDYAPSVLKWANSNVAGGTVYLGRTDAWKDHDGRAKTATVVNTLGENAPAAKFCADYYPSNVAEDQALFGKGRWWLPASGDLWMMYSHFNEINHALSLINGTLLVQEYHWSITETSASIAWYLNFGNGTFYGYYGKSSYSFRVRPVSAFY